LGVGLGTGLLVELGPDALILWVGNAWDVLGGGSLMLTLLLLLVLGEEYLLLLGRIHVKIRGNGSLGLLGIRVAHSTKRKAGHLRHGWRGIEGGYGGGGEGRQGVARWESGIVATEVKQLASSKLDVVTSSEQAC